MGRTAAEALATKKYEKEKIDKILLRVPKGEREKIAAFAKEHNESTNAFIIRAINETMQRAEEKGC